MQDATKFSPAPDRPVLLAGPTAVGKNALALTWARQTPSWIINADALQVYKDWEILTARPDKDERAQAPHKLYGHIGLTAPYSTGHWLRELRGILTDAKTQGIRPIILGGTGLYFQAATQGLAEIPHIEDATRRAADQIAEQGLGTFAELLAQSDPESLSRIDAQNPARTRRAWEVLRQTGRGIATWQDKTPPALLPLPEITPVLLSADTDWLNDRIDRRFLMMVDRGALDECRAVLATGWDPRLPSCQAIGAKELISHLHGDIALDAAIAEAQTQSRQYAKRQRTWFRSKMKDWIHLSAHA